jgi:rubrerythrin
VTPQPHYGGKSPTDDYVAFFSTGQPVKGEFHCADCGYGVTIHRTLPTCPMCGGETWEQAPWSPLSRAAHLQ